VRGSVAAVLSRLSEEEVRGEYTLVVAGARKRIRRRLRTKKFRRK